MSRIDNLFLEHLTAQYRARSPGLELLLSSGLELLGAVGAEEIIRRLSWRPATSFISTIGYNSITTKVKLAPPRALPLLMLGASNANAVRRYWDVNAKLDLVRSSDALSLDVLDLIAPAPGNGVEGFVDSSYTIDDWVATWLVADCSPLFREALAVRISVWYNEARARLAPNWNGAEGVPNRLILSQRVRLPISARLGRVVAASHDLITSKQWVSRLGVAIHLTAGAATAITRGMNGYKLYVLTCMQIPALGFPVNTDVEADFIDWQTVLREIDRLTSLNVTQANLIRSAWEKVEGAIRSLID